MKDCYPAVILLPGGERAELVAGAPPPRYTIAGQSSDIDVTIPDDLVALGWCWSGSFLYQPWPERPDGPGVAIATCTYPPPGYPIPGGPMALKYTDDDGRARVQHVDRGTCFDAARRLDAKRTELRAMPPPKKAKKKKAAPVVVAEPEPEQMVLL